MSEDCPEKCVLIVEDEDDLRLVLKMTVEQLFGLRVIEAADGETGVRLAHQEKPTLILMDLMLPVKNGFEAIADIQSNSKMRDIPIVVISDHCWIGDVKDKVVVSGAIHCIDKTYLLEQLPKVLQSILADH